jgi:hypothetical protein
MTPVGVSPGDSRTLGPVDMTGGSRPPATEEIVKEEGCSEDV